MLLGFMLPTWFLSMWISNTATTVMMITIAESILSCLENPGEDSESENLDEDYKRDVKKLGVALSLCTCYSSSCGGIATLIGTGPNTILLGIVESRYGSVKGFDFACWMAYALPLSVMQLLSTWIVLMLIHIGPRDTFRCGKHRSPRTLELQRKFKSVIDREAEKLGSISFQEYSAGFLFASAGILWMSRSQGWGKLTKNTQDKNKVVSYVKDGQVGMLVALLALVWPARNPLTNFRAICKKHRNAEDEKELVKKESGPLFLMPWDVVNRRFPWGILMTLGGSFALSKISEKSGVSQWTGEKLSQLKELPPQLLVFIVTMVTSVLTELVSNVGTATILVPISIDLAKSMNQHPFLFSFPMTISASFAFCLPVSTPPNAIVYAHGRVTVRQMLVTGILLNLSGVLFCIVCTITYAYPLFGLDTLPDWANN
ncbi:hypothetical protein Ciccas_013492 [Cichlidogyrus casuarinus]|uniref:Solute carrier family 13 member 5 n=1 Tax=Cichlidogyrus casuarinus TaxID=1844966 RepID=A0ABD2PLX7_9PLAT